jgi:RNA polymerase sigma factor (sigma-70 family)
LEENQLIELLKAQNETAFRNLVDNFQRKVFNTVLSIVQNTEEAEDVSQEVFIEVYQSVSKFKGESKLSTWIYRIATTKALEAYRKKHAQKRFSFLTSLFGGEKDELIHDSPDFEHPGVVLENKERAGILFQAINKLPENQRVAFTLHNIEGLSYQEITEVMQTSLSSVESMLFRAKSNLKVSLKGYYTSIYKS